MGQVAGRRRGPDHQRFPLAEPVLMSVGRVGTTQRVRWTVSLEACSRSEEVTRGWRVETTQSMRTDDADRNATPAAPMLCRLDPANRVARCTIVASAMHTAAGSP